MCYNNKLEGNITLEIYKRTYNNLTIEIDESKNKLKTYEMMLYEMENNIIDNNKYYVEKAQEFLKIENPSRALITTLIDRI